MGWTLKLWKGAFVIILTMCVLRFSQYFWKPGNESTLFHKLDHSQETHSVSEGKADVALRQTPSKCVDKGSFEKTTSVPLKELPRPEGRDDFLWCQYLMHDQRVNPHPYRFVINAHSLCAEAPFLLIVVPSVCNHTEFRKEIRLTWGNVVHTRQWANGVALPAIKLAFLFGMPQDDNCSQILNNESKLHGDIISSDFIDSYRNLTLKSVSLLKWVTSFCKDVPYVMKCDEDTFVHLPRLLRLIKKVNSPRTLIGGIVIHTTPFKSGKWKVNYTEYPFREYPPYLHGPVYVIPGKVIPKLFYLSEYFKFLPVEDVFVTGILAKCSGAKITQVNKLIDFSSFNFHGQREKKSCYLHKTYRRISVTKAAASDLKILWNSFKIPSTCRGAQGHNATEAQVENKTERWAKNSSSP